MSIMNIYVFMGISIVRMQWMCAYNLFIYLFGNKISKEIFYIYILFLYFT